MHMDGMIILKLIGYTGWEYKGFSWLRKETSGGPLRTR